MTDVLAPVPTLTEMRQALADGLFEVHYQPIVDVRTGNTVQLEALVRWPHPLLGMLPAGQFVPTIEREGLAPELGRWMLQVACAQVAAYGQLRRSGRRNPPVLAVNASAHQLEDPRFPDFVADTLVGTGLPAEQLCIEITESAILDQTVAVRASLARLRSHGVQIAVDDFGTGYATLAALRQIPATAVKIDRLFTRVEASAVDRAIVASVLGLAERLDLTVIAEGVEDQVQASALAAMGCMLQQGFHHARPAPLLMPVRAFRRPARPGAAHRPAERPPVTPDEEARLHSLRWYTSAASGAAEVLDGIVALAASVCGRPTALLSMVDRDDLWFLAHYGLEGLVGTRRSESICDVAITAPSFFEVADTFDDRRFVHLPLVAGWPRVRSYAGAPLVTREGQTIGMLCVVDGEPGRLTEGQQALLKQLAHHTMSVLELVSGPRA